VLEHRALPDGGFRHDERDSAGPYLADTLAMARAFLALYTVTAERDWLAKAQAAAAFMDANFRAPVGFATAASSPKSAFPPKPEVDENIALARFANLLGDYTGQESWRAMAAHAMRYLAAPAVIKGQGFSTSGILLADRELGAAPAHLTIVGAKQDPAALTLYTLALRGAPGFARIEWFDPKEGPLPNPDVQYPVMPRAAAFVCAAGTCSIPMQTPAQLAKRLAQLARR